MPQFNVNITVDNQTAMANVYIDVDIPRTVTVPNPPDYTWTHTDSNHHFHAYNAKGELPMLDAESNGSVTHYCKICREPVTPATLPDPVDIIVNIHPPWAVRVNLPNPPAHNRVSVRAQPAGQPIHFGTAMVDSVTGSGPYQVDLIGEAPIAKMKA